MLRTTDASRPYFRHETFPTLQNPSFPHARSPTRQATIQKNVPPSPEMPPNSTYDGGVKPSGYSPLPTRALVTNAVPFRMEHGLPHEVGAILFDPKTDHSILTGGAVCASPSESERHENRHALPGKGGTDSRTAEGGKKEEQGYQKNEKGEKEHGPKREMWVPKPDPIGTGEILTYAYRGFKGGEGVEVRIRGRSLEAKRLARAGVPKDLLALVVHHDHAATGKVKLLGTGGIGVFGRKGKAERAVGH